MQTAQSEKQDYVVRNDREGVAELVLNRPQSYNALSIDCMTNLLSQFREIDKDPSARVVVLSGSGGRFCAGHDLKELSTNKSRDFYQQTFDLCVELMLTIRNLSKPVVAKVSGIATAAGCQLVATCDLAVAEENARFATPGVNIGLFCSTPMVALSRNVSNKHAMEMLLLGDFISAERALEFGLINQVVPAEELDTAVDNLAQKIVAKSPLTLKIGKQAFYEQKEKDLPSAYAYTAEVMVENLMARDAEEGINAFFEKRKPQWTGE